MRDERIEELRAYAPTEDAPEPDSDVDSEVGELETFARELDEVVSELDGVEFPGMYG